MSKLIIDDFNATSVQPIIVQSTAPGPTSVVDDGGSGVLGEYRNATLSFLTGDSSAIVSYSVTGDGQCSFNFGPLDSQAQLTLLWDANGAGLSLDLSQYTELFVDVASLDHPGVPIMLTIHSQGQTYSQQLSATSTVTLDFLFSKFYPVPDSTALANVSAIQMSIDGQTDLDLGLDNVGAL